MSPLVSLLMYGWIPITVYLFTRFPPQRAMLVSFIVATLFLPEASFQLPGIGSFTKITSACFGIMLATLIYDPGRFSSWKPGWFDLPILVLCLWVIPSQLSNGLSPFSPTIGQTLTWGMPYFLGRIYLNNLAGLRQLAIGIFMGGLSYVPLCLFEIRMSPQLHQWVYGFVPRTDFSQTIRLGGYRPTVFMEHGLAVGMWMMAATLTGVWLWQSGVIKKLWNIPISWLVMALSITFALVKSTGAYIYFAVGLIILLVGKWFRTAVLLFLVIFGISSYLYLGATGEFYTIPQVVSFVNNSLNQVGDDASADRSGSYAFRIQNEEFLSRKARQRMIFGWGDSGANRVADPKTGQDISVTDSLWIIIFGTRGIVGLISFAALFLLPAASFCLLRYPASTWSHPKVGSVAVLAVVITMYLLDCCLNALPNPVFLLASGGISGLLQNTPVTKKLRGTQAVASQRSLAQQRPN